MQQPVPPINRRERSVRPVERVQRPRLLTPSEREEARLERARRRADRNLREAAKEPPGGVDHFG